jgi:hypothetical protein
MSAAEARAVTAAAGDNASMPHTGHTTPGAAAGSCYICLEGASTSAGELLRGGCACRGGSGWVHAGCAVRAAQADEDAWDTCPTCKQEWTGRLELWLCREHWRLASTGPAWDSERRDNPIVISEEKPDIFLY